MFRIWPDDRRLPTDRDGVHFIMDDEYPYFVSGSLLAKQPNLLSENRVVLTEFIRNAGGNVDIDTVNIGEIIKQTEPPSQHETSERLLLALYQRTPHNDIYIFDLGGNEEDLPLAIMREAGVGSAASLLEALQHLDSMKLIYLREEYGKVEVRFSENGMSVARALPSPRPAKGYDDRAGEIDPGAAAAAMTEGGVRRPSGFQDGAADLAEIPEAAALGDPAATEMVRRVVPSASTVIHSVGWTGLQTPEHQIKIVAAYAPIAGMAAQQLAEAIEARKLNEPEAVDALENIKALHWAIGELIAAAEEERLSRKLWKQYEATREKALDALFSYPQAFLSAPVAAVAMAHMLSFVSGYPITEQMVTTLCAGGVIGEAVRRKAGR